MKTRSGIETIRFRTPMGTLVLRTDGEAVVSLRFQRGRTHTRAAAVRNFRVRGWVRQIQGYFRGKRKNFSVPLSRGGTRFQKKVWAETLRIPYGRTATYGQVARRIGRPRALRAVAGALSRNPLPILVPCHRVIAAGGSLGGYSEGLGRKKRLLSLEHIS